MMSASPDTGKSGESTVVIKIQESTDSATTQESSGMATCQNVVGPSRTETSKSLTDPAESGESTGVETIPESSGMATSQNVVGPSRTEISKPEISKISTESTESGEAKVTVEIQESPGMETSQNVVGPSRTEISKPEISKISTKSAESGEATVTVEIQESSGMETSQNVVGPSRTEISTTIIESAVSGESPGVEKIQESLRRATVQNLVGPEQDMNTTETTDDRQSVGSPMDGGSVPLNRVAEAGVSASDEHVVTKAKSFKENIDKIGEILWKGYFQPYHKVRIFSRSSESEYEWLTNVLQSQDFHSTVSTVRPHYISNNGRLQFMEAVSQCTFGILYHTKNRGRINIVNVTDSLYDEELKYMSERLGKGNVIVVVDDLEDTSDEERTRILDTQYSIKELARDIILFNATEKKAVTTEEIPEES